MKELLYSSNDSCLQLSSLHLESLETDDDDGGWQNEHNQYKQEQRGDCNDEMISSKTLDSTIIVEDLKESGMIVSVLSTLAKYGAV